MVYYSSPGLIPANTSPVCVKAATEPRGIASPVIAVARPLSSSPNQRLQMMFYADRNIGPASEMTNDPTSIDQKWPSNVLICLIQHPAINRKAPRRRVVAADMTVNMRIVKKNIGTAVMPKQRVHKLTWIKGTE
jgi:hypothetical protein